MRILNTLTACALIRSNPFGALFRIWDHRNLIGQLTKIDIIDRYKGSVLGLFWSLLLPIATLAIYTIVFSEIFNARWGGDADQSTSDFALNIFMGMMYYLFFVECLTLAPRLMINNADFVKKTVFPLDLLPWVTLGGALFHLAVSFVVLLSFYMFFHGAPPISTLWTPLIALPFLLITMGLIWLLAALGVYFRDLAQIVGALTTMLLFLSPVFYPVSQAPESWRVFFYLNPLTYPIVETRVSILAGGAPDWGAFTIAMVAGLFTFWIGNFSFMMMKKGFADVL